ncbi:hypothetical protein [uncultured Sphingomonas sp.]|uniref:hypothetical protein n=1 Tax=uncultured Sphingomonas sp. TaxID=158754 RepID=UPI0035C981C8
MIFAIEDEAHGAPGATFGTGQEVRTELRRLAGIARDEEPNRAPCTSWQTCDRRVAYDDALTPWRTLTRTHGLDISAEGVRRREQPSSIRTG